MLYPTLDQVEKASRTQLARWYRFLPSPGNAAIGKKTFEKILGEEKLVMDRICERFNKLGGMTPEISKILGWDAQ